MRGIRHIAACAALLLTGACMDYGPLDEEAFDLSGRGLFITCEGNFTSDNATLTYYDPATRRVENEVFLRANGMKLGDVAQSMTIRDGRGYVVVNNSGVVYEIDPSTFRVTGLIEGVVSPRYLRFLDAPNDTTAYLTDLYDPHIAVIDTRNNRIRNRIPTNGHSSTEQLVQWGEEVFVNCWSYDSKLLVVDTRRERVVDSIEVGWQPSSIALDRYGKLWVACESVNSASPELRRIDAATRTTERIFSLPPGSKPSQLTLNGARDTLYFICRDVWRLPVGRETPEIFLPYAGTIYYGLGVDPATSEVYVADAVDYVQHGAVYRFTARGAAVDTLRVGITPGSFCFKP